MAFDGFFRLRDGHVIDVHTPVQSEIDHPVRLNDVRAADQLQPSGVGQDHVHLITRLETFPQVLLDGEFGLLDRHPRQGHGAVIVAEVYSPVGFDPVDPLDRLLRQGVGHADPERIQGFDPVGRPGDQPEGVDRQNVGRFDDVGGERNFGQFVGDRRKRLVLGESRATPRREE